MKEEKKYKQKSKKNH